MVGCYDRWRWRLDRFAKGFRFDNADQEAEFRARAVAVSLKAWMWWCLWTAGFIFIAAILLIIRFSNLINVVVLVTNFVPAFLVVLVTLFVKFVPAAHPHVTLVACCLAVSIVGWTAWLLSQVIRLEVDQSNADLSLVLPIVAPYPEAAAQLKLFVANMSTSKDVWPAILFCHLYLDFLRFFVYRNVVLVIYFCLPITMALANQFSPVIKMSDAGPVLGALLCSVYACGATLHTVLLQRGQFLLDYELREARVKAEVEMKEAMAVQTAMQASQEADNILNHILKNVMADASGCIDIVMPNQTEGVRRHLGMALGALRRGMKWCKRRQGILRIVEGKHLPSVMVVDLREFGSDIALGREMRFACVDAQIRFDATLCDILLDNAINNAFKHGHETDPAVELTITTTEAQPTDQRTTVTFRVTNRANTSRPVLSPSFLDDILSGRTPSGPMNALSDHLGLRHIFGAAQAHGVQVSLQQQGTIVVFEARVEAELGGSTPSTSSPSFALTNEEQHALLGHHRGLRIHCIDDSPIARTVLAHFLKLDPDCVEVCTYGEDATEVDAFLDNAVACADAVVMDQHLEYAARRFLGTELAQILLSRGYTGLICIRSANTTAADEEEYLASGAHCVVGKEVHPKELLARLKVERRRLAKTLPKSPKRSALQRLLSWGKDEGAPVDVLPGQIE